MTDYAERFPELLDECHDLVQEVSPDGTILRVNRAWRDTLGYDESELHRLNLFDILHPACKDHCRAQFGRVLLGGAIKDVEATLVAKDGQAIAVLGSCRCLFSSDQQATSCFGVFHDITHRKKAEDELKQREAELEERVHDRTEAVTKMNEALKMETQKLGDATAELTRSNKDLEHFAFIAAHDLRAPLRHVGAYCELLAQRAGGQLDDEANEYLSHVVVATDHMMEMLDSLLEYSRVGTHGGELVLVESGDVLQCVLANLSKDIDASQATVTHGTLPVVMANRNQMVRLFQNLIGNAINYRSDKAPSIHVACQRNDHEWEFSVRDNGVGIDPKHVDRIFEIFSRLHTNEEYPGTGIGLAICKRIVERHGGRIWCTSKPDRGTTFHFTLPRISKEIEP